MASKLNTLGTALQRLVCKRKPSLILMLLGNARATLLESTILDFITAVSILYSINTSGSITRMDFSNISSINEYNKQYVA